MIRRLDTKTFRCRAAYIVFILLAGALIVRGFYGFCQSDESFYVSTAGRFAMGDLVFVDEWHPTQLGSLITMPFYILYTSVTGGTYGIILYFRILYVVFTTLEAAAVYHFLSPRGSFAAFNASLFLMLYCHLNIPTLSYYTMSFHFFILAFVLVYAAKIREGAGNALYASGGMAFALSVLSLPSLVLAYFIVMAVLLICCTFVRSIRRPLVLFTLGVGIIFAVFLVYLYAGGNSIAGLLANLPYIMSDAEHDRGYVESFKVFFRAVSDEFGRIYYLNIVLVILAMLTYVNQTIKNHIRHYILLADVLLYAYYVILGCRHTGFVNTAFALFVFPLFFLTEKKDWYIFLTFFMGGLAFSMTYSFSSFCDLYVLSIGHGIAAFGGILLLWDHITENHENSCLGRDIDTETNEAKRICKVADIYVPAIAILVLVAVTGVLRFTYIYRDDRLFRLDQRISRGPAAGLFTSEEHLEQYESVLSSIEKYTFMEEETDGVLFSKLLPWGYTASGLRASAPDTWRNMISGDRLMEYYRDHKMPDIVFVLNSDIGSYETSGDVQADPAPNLNEFEGEFADILRSRYEEHTEKDCTVYIRQDSKNNPMLSYRDSGRVD